MNKYDIHYIEPDFYQNFRCTGNNCRNNCCNYPWRITVDKNTYKKYMNLTKPEELVKDLRKYIKKNPTAKNNDNFATLNHIQKIETDKGFVNVKSLDNGIISDANNNSTTKISALRYRCIFQTETGLCNIHATYGSEFLCKTCKTYPRTEAIVNNNKIESTTYPSCEVVIEAFLNNTQPMEFTTTVQAQTESPLKNTTHNFAVVLSDQTRPILKYYYDIKMIGIALLQNRDISFEDRFLTLGIFCQNLQAIEDGTSTDYPALTDIPRFLNDFVAQVEAGGYNRLFEIKTNIERQNMMSYFTLKLYEDGGIILPEYFDRFTKNFEITDFTTNEERAEKTFALYKEYLQNYQALMADKEHFLENLFVNEFFRYATPFGIDATIWENYEFLVMQYAMMRLMVMGNLGHRTTMDTTEFVDLVTYYGRMVAHAIVKISDVIKLIKENEMDSFPYMAVMIKSTVK